ncbi:copper-binding protein [Massilia soli]|uniref:Copper-binding protein n=1 Tax=Massilia soli TaxID=2792854 RepID=A0ABS7SUX7_9BURK|nr:copper-binding protein [Massilia soli]MBZ2209743.1 copper-binding protein [Massilia soli]
MKLNAFLIAAALALPLTATALAESPAASAAAPVALVAGEVKKVDKDTGKMTIKHGPLANLDMPAMTMVFRVKDPAMLDKVKAGDKIKFAAERANGAITVTQLDVAK